jgi:hypothetical protein
MRLRRAMEKDVFLDFLNEMSPPPKPPVGRDKPDLPEPKESIIPTERVAFLLFPFFIELIDQFKDTLKNLRNLTKIFHDKYGDKESSAYLSRIISDDIKKIELVQNSLLNYIRINNPVTKANTVNTLIEEELKKYEFDLEEKKIRLFKTLEKNLPETAVPDDQLRYIVSCILQYIMALIPTSGNLGVFTKNLVLEKERGEDRERRFIEILIAYTGYRKPAESFRSPMGIPAHPKEKILDLALKLVDEIVQRNRGMMKFEEDEKKAKATISLRFPVERRKVVYYQQSGDVTSNIHEFKSTFEKLASLEELKRGG